MFKKNEIKLNSLLKCSLINLDKIANLFEHEKCQLTDFYGVPRDLPLTLVRFHVKQTKEYITPLIQVSYIGK